uniref:DUF2272 domain-containing protein n=1 Tax=Phenylobacterium glaciei TaxID=2803784 RepID=A0A974P4B9_9CAUL|nr:DUF2272 domain-containing protein [Phenylobacterium glaciei]
MLAGVENASASKGAYAYESHCDIVSQVALAPKHVVHSIGGNVGDTVTKTERALAGGPITTGRPIAWIAVLVLKPDPTLAAPAPPPAPPAPPPVPPAPEPAPVPPAPTPEPTPRRRHRPCLNLRRPYLRRSPHPHRARHRLRNPYLRPCPRRPSRRPQRRQRPRPIPLCQMSPTNRRTSQRPRRRHALILLPCGVESEPGYSSPAMRFANDLAKRRSRPAREKDKSSHLA